MATTPEGPGSNPYGAPLAPVSDAPSADARGLVDGGRALPAGRALEWYEAAWRLFRVSPGAWIGIWLLFAVCVIVVSLFPLLGMFANALLTPIFLGGVMLAARSGDRAGWVPVGHLFAAFGSHAGPLALIGLLQLVIQFAFVMLFGILVAMILPNLGTFSARGTFEGFLAAAWLPLVGIGLAMAIVYLPIAYATWMAAALVSLHDVPAMDALRMGFTGVFRNVLPLLGFFVVGLVLAVLASIPVMLGWLVLGPLFLCALYVQYRDVFAAGA
jgi:uncharacterized membrane protein